jgi:hypothetical protein
MGFASDGDVKKALIKSIMYSIEERKAKLCDT